MSTKVKQISIFLFLFLGFNFNSLFAQQDFNLTHYSFNKLLVNPAVAGNNNYFRASAIGKLQWSTMTDETTQYSNGGVESETFRIGQETFAGIFSAPLFKSKKYTNFSYGGMGLSYSADNAAYLTAQNLKLSLAGRIPLNDGTSSLGIGIDIGCMQMSLDGTKLTAKHPNDPNFPKGKQTDRNMNLGAGVYYTNSTLNNLYIGLSATRINTPIYIFKNNANEINIKPVKHYYLMSGMEIKTKNKNIEIHPSILVKYNSTVQIDLTTIVQIKKKYYTGIGYRTSYAATYVMIGIKPINNLRLGYSTDFSITSLRKSGFLTHELQANYRFRAGK